MMICAINKSTSDDPVNVVPVILNRGQKIKLWLTDKVALEIECDTIRAKYVRLVMAVSGDFEFADVEGGK